MAYSACNGWLWLAPLAMLCYDLLLETSEETFGLILKLDARSETNSWNTHKPWNGAWESRRGRTFCSTLVHQSLLRTFWEGLVMYTFDGMLCTFSKVL